jgi:very-short-patch-repair endonuclease
VYISGGPDERIAAVAGRQRGRVSRRQLRAVGISDRSIHHRVTKGILVREQRGVYAAGHSAPLPLAAETAALLACGDHAVLSHHSAAWLWKIVPDADGVIDITIRGRDGSRPKRVRVHRTEILNGGLVRIVEGVPVTSPARTLIDIAPELDGEAFWWAVNEALVQKLVTHRELEAAVARARGRRGASILAALLESQREPAITRSRAERRFLWLIHSAQLPRPQANVRVHGYSVDAYWPDLGVVVEVQSHKFHSGRAAFERDARKAARLTAAGLTVVYVTWRQMDEEPYAVVARVAQVLALAQARRTA